MFLPDSNNIGFKKLSVKLIIINLIIQINASTDRSLINQAAEHAVLKSVVSKHVDIIMFNIIIK